MVGCQRTPTELLLCALTSTCWELYIIIVTVTTIWDIHESIHAVQMMKLRLRDVTSPVQGDMVGSHDHDSKLGD